MTERTTSQDVSDRIAAKAYAIWQEEGCPEGRAEVHWTKAEALVLGDAARPGLSQAGKASASGGVSGKRSKAGLAEVR